ncbi:hypothetical protein Goari_023225 [Gossypium aridum]|uniref:Uncharacterized protein n=1 Tax=Gossypium aridum TaxID=34290 RepID=A0A7J8X2G9_GOSAI|nr:hypothetical protein [Gossypium aridum]
MSENQKPQSHQNLPSSPNKSIPEIESNAASDFSGHQRVRFPNPPDLTNPDPSTLRDQWRYAIRQYSRWYSHAWGTAILAGVSFFALVDMFGFTTTVEGASLIKKKRLKLEEIVVCTGIIEASLIRKKRQKLEEIVSISVYSLLVGKSVDAIKNPASKKDMSTSTVGLGNCVTQI